MLGDFNVTSAINTLNAAPNIRRQRNDFKWSPARAKWIIAINLAIDANIEVGGKGLLWKIEQQWTAVSRADVEHTGINNLSAGKSIIHRTDLHGNNFIAHSNRSS